ncbi:MAG: oligosaccharide repeat unit polymerase [Alphaproteobacteria bacterium]|nr:oligosaccharide repeat unit polymerase [Alphaproteobacteria bacterium]
MAFYLLLNLIYTVLIINNWALYSEARVVSVDSTAPVIAIFLLLAASYIFFQTFWFNFVSKIRVIRVRADAPEIVDKRVSLTLLALQLMFLAYALSSGAYVADSTVQGGSFLSLIWVFIPVDVLSFIYYGFYRRSPYFKINCAAWLISSFLRGWSGILLTIIFFESCRLIRARTIRMRHVFASVAALVIGYPLIYFGKLFIRFYAAAQQSTDFSTFWSLYESINIFEALGIAVQQAFDRLQLISSSVAVHEIAPALRADYYNNMFQPFWLEGLHGLALDRLLGRPEALNVGQVLALQLDPLSLVNWNANPTLIGWFFILPQYAVFNFLYALLLGAVFVLLGRMLKQTPESRDMMWYAWLILLIPGWYGAMFLYVYVMFLFVALHMIFEPQKKAGRNMAEAHCGYR